VSFLMPHSSLSFGYLPLSAVLRERGWGRGSFSSRTSDNLPFANVAGGRGARSEQGDKALHHVVHPKASASGVQSRRSMSQLVSALDFPDKCPMVGQTNVQIAQINHRSNSFPLIHMSGAQHLRSTRCSSIEQRHCTVRGSSVASGETPTLVGETTYSFLPMPRYVGRLRSPTAIALLDNQGIRNYTDYSYGNEYWFASLNRGDVRGTGGTSINQRFAVAVHVLALARVAKEELAGTAITSERLAESVGAHPVHVRRVLGTLREAGLVTSQPGPGGGWKLTRAPEEITLNDIYRAVEHEPIFALPTHPPGTSVDCPVGQCLPGVLTTCLQEAEAALQARLAQVTIADLIGAVRAEMDRAGYSHFNARVASHV
jgi:Rrf2 family protein